MMAAAQAAAEAALAEALAEEERQLTGGGGAPTGQPPSQAAASSAAAAAPVVGGGSVGNSAMAAAMAAAAAADAEEMQQLTGVIGGGSGALGGGSSEQLLMDNMLGMTVPGGGSASLPQHLQQEQQQQQQPMQQSQQQHHQQFVQQQLAQEALPPIPQQLIQQQLHPQQYHHQQQPQTYHQQLPIQVPQHQQQQILQQQQPIQIQPQHQQQQIQQQHHPPPAAVAPTPPPQQQQSSTNTGIGIDPTGGGAGFQEQVLRDLLGNVNDGGNTAQQLLQLLASEESQKQQQQQQQQQQDQLNSSAECSMNVNDGMPPRREEQLMTISQNGTILEATETVLGFPPDALLMTSAYHTMHDLDLPGFLFVKTHFWDKGDPNVEVYIRRRNIDGEFVWLASKALDYVTHPIPGIIIVESRVQAGAEEQMANSLNRITRITAILVQAVEAAKLAKAKQPPAAAAAAAAASAGEHVNNEAITVDGNVGVASATGTTGEENSTEANNALQSLISTLQETETHNPDDGKALQELLQIVAATAKMNNGQLEPSEEEIMKNLGRQKEKGFDPFLMMEKVRKGVRLDLGMTRLLPEEVKMIALVLSGKVSVDVVAPTVLNALRSGQGLEAAFREYKLDMERDKSPRRNHSGSISGTSMGGGAGSSTSLGSGGGYNSDPHVLAANAVSNFVSVPQPAGGIRRSSFKKSNSNPSLSIIPQPKAPPPPISVINVSYTYIGNVGMEMLSEVIYMNGSALRTIDVSFCGLEEKGMIAFAKALSRRKKRDIPPLKGLILSGNVLTARAAFELGSSLSGSGSSRDGRYNRSRSTTAGGGYDTDTDSGGEDDDDDDDDDFNSRSRSGASSGGPRRRDGRHTCCTKESGLQLLHLASTSLKPESIHRLLDGLGPHCSLRELSLASNGLGAAGTSALVRFLEKGKDRSLVHVPMPFLDRLDMSNNNLGDDGTTQLTRAILKRSKIHLVDLQLSTNAITSVGVETMMNKLLNHNLVSLSLYKNLIGDQGCQLVAASLQSMKALARLNLSFNQIGSRGIVSLMRRLIGCESITFLGLSGNILKISGAIALSYTLSQHPRLEELHLDNCCLSQAAQCHIVAGIISNRWVPMKRLMGYAVGPPMVAIGALKQYTPNMNNEECFRIRKDEQMKTILRWMETNRVAKQTGNTPDPAIAAAAFTDASEQRFLSPDFISSINDVHGTPSQNSYLRLLGWLSLIPFDDDELTALQKYFYDGEGGEGDRGSDGYINLRARGDLLAALDSDVADEIREELPSLAPTFKGSVGYHLSCLELCKLEDVSKWNAWGAFKGQIFDKPSKEYIIDESCETSGRGSMERIDEAMEESETPGSEQAVEEQQQSLAKGKDMPRTESATSATTKEKNKNKAKPRISMFPKFEQQLEDLKATAAEMIEQEEDPMHHEVILTQYAEASLTILRQLRYHCMNRGLDGWVHGGLKRKVLIVDDSRVTRKLVSTAFEKANFIVDTAANGKEGVEKLKASIYDIAFMDIDMPVMNGFEATKTLRKWEDTMRPGARQPICALTATYVDDFERSELMKFKEAGLDVMESKPCNIPRLFKVVDDVAPMMSDLRITISQREKSDSSLNKALGQHAATDSSN